MTKKDDIIGKIGDLLNHERKNFLKYVKESKMDICCGDMFSANAFIDEIMDSEYSGWYKYFDEFSTPKKDKSRYKVKNAPDEFIIQECSEALKNHETRERFELFFGGSKEEAVLENYNERCNGMMEEIRRAVLFSLTYNDYCSMLKRMRVKNQHSIEGYLLEHIIRDYPSQMKVLINEFSKEGTQYKILRKCDEIETFLRNLVAQDEQRNYAWYPIMSDELSSVTLYMVMVPEALIAVQCEEYDCTPDDMPKNKKSRTAISIDKSKLRKMYIVVYHEWIVKGPSIEEICDETINLWLSNKYQSMRNDGEGYSIYYKENESFSEAVKKYQNECNEVRKSLFEMREELKESKKPTKFDKTLNEATMSVQKKPNLVSSKDKVRNKIL